MRRASSRAPQRGKARLASLTATLIAGGLSGCVHPSPDVAASPPAPIPEIAATPGVSGRPSTPLARLEQTLPLVPVRTISFETSTGTSLSLDVSPDGREIIFDMLGDIYTLPEGGGEAERLTSGLAVDTQPVFSPDGSTIAFLSDRSGAENLWLMDRDGGNPRQVSFYDDNPTFVSPEWTRDGSAVLVSRFWPDRNAYELWQFDVGPGDMGHVVRAADIDTDPPSSSLDATAAPDRQTVYLASLSEGSPSFDELSPWQIVRLDLATGEEAIVLPALQGEGEVIPRFRPTVSPDGGHLAFAERRAGRTRLMLLDLASGEIRELAKLDPDSLEASLWHDAAPRFDFSPDSGSLYANIDGGISRIELETGTITQLPLSAQVDQNLGKLVRHQAEIDEGEVQARLIQSPAVSSDGTQVAFSALGHLYTQSLAGTATPIALRSDGRTGYHPAWSPDGTQIASVSWTNAEGGRIWISSADGTSHRPVTDDGAFYTHPVFTPAGDALIAVRSPAEKRRETYMEFGQLREAELVRLPLDGSAETVLASGRIGGTPHFRGVDGEVLINSDDGVISVSLDTGETTPITQAVGPNWYFAHGPAAADDLRVSPDGHWALAQIAQQLHIHEIPAGDFTEVDLSSPTVRHAKLTSIGADYFGWNADGSALFWSVGSTLYEAGIDEIAFDGDPLENRASRHDISITAPRDTPSGQVLLTNANILAMTERSAPGEVLVGDILIDGNKIAAIGAHGSLSASPNAEVVDLAGAWVIPGLIDAHYHVADIRRDVLQFDAWGLKTGLAYGVTTLFDPSSLTIDMLTYEDLVETGDILGSRLYTTGPAIFDFNDFRSKEEVLDVLRRYREHYRLWNLKQYRTGNRRVREWVVQAADELGMTVTTEGALSYKLNLTHILDGFSGVEHAMPPAVHHRDLTELFARSQTSSTLTLMITHGGRPADKVFIDRTNPLEDTKYARFAPDWFRESRFADVTAASPEQYLYRQIGFSASQLFHAGGVVGLGAHGDIPGFGTHWEMQAYVKGSWSPAETLWAATMGSAITIGRDENLGSLAPGKLADLVVLKASPLDDIANTLAIEYVMKNGRLYDGDTLEELTAQ